MALNFNMNIKRETCDEDMTSELKTTLGHSAWCSPNGDSVPKSVIKLDNDNTEVLVKTEPRDEYEEQSQPLGVAVKQEPSHAVEEFIAKAPDSAEKHSPSNGQPLVVKLFLTRQQMLDCQNNNPGTDPLAHYLLHNPLKFVKMKPKVDYKCSSPIGKPEMQNEQRISPGESLLKTSRVRQRQQATSNRSEDDNNKASHFTKETNKFVPFQTSYGVYNNCTIEFNADVSACVLPNLFKSESLERPSRSSGPSMLNGEFSIAENPPVSSDSCMEDSSNSNCNNAKSTHLGTTTDSDEEDILSVGKENLDSYESTNSRAVKWGKSSHRQIATQPRADGAITTNFLDYCRPSDERLSSNKIRIQHNNRERQRRNGMKILFDRLRDEIPSIEDQNASKLNILREAKRLLVALMHKNRQLRQQKLLLQEQQCLRQELLASLESNSST